MDHPKSPNQNFKGAPRHEAPKPDRSKEQMNQFDGKVNYMDHPEGPSKKIEGAPQHKAPEHEQSKQQKNQPSEGEVGYMDHPKGPDKRFKGAIPQHKAPELEQPKQQKKQPTEGEVGYMDHPKAPDQRLKGAPQHEDPKLDQSKKQESAPQHEVVEPNQFDKQMNQPEGEVGYMDHPKGPDKKFKDAPQPQHMAPEPDQSQKQMNQSEGVVKVPNISTPKPAIEIADDKGKQSPHNTEKVDPPILPPQKVPIEEVEDKINGTGNKKKPEDSPSHLSATSEDEESKGDASEATILKQPDEKQQEHIEVNVDDEVDTAEEVVASESTRIYTLEILKSIVYGGLIESLASLSVVISAASADATTLNIVALAIANLIGGLFVLGHNLEELKSEQVDRYIEILGQKKNFILHAFIATISFILFGIVPPVVYGFSFRGSDDKDFKLAAVAVASLLCITMLSISKAYIKSSTYYKTVLYYVSTGAVASVLSYLAGVLVNKLIEKLGWFDESASNFALQIPGIAVQ